MLQEIHLFPVFCELSLGHSVLIMAFFPSSKSRTIVLYGLSVMTFIAIGMCCWTGKVALDRYLMEKDKRNIADLNQKVSMYLEKAGKLPDPNLVDLYHHGLTARRLHQTPFGGYYRLDVKQSMVYNPNR